ncbi:MAG: transcription termination/antitermination protein NusG [Aureliella sp.]
MSESETTTAAPSPMDWYIVKVAFNREDSIRDALHKRIKLQGLESLFGEILIPTEDVVTFTRNGTRRVVKRKLYPGYLMIYMSVNDDSWFLVRETPGVGDFTGAGGKPTPMDPHDVERIIKSVRPPEEGEQALKTAIPFRVGDRVRVKEGYFQNLEGDVEKVDEANGQITVMISIFGRSTPVELNHWQVEAV